MSVFLSYSTLFILRQSISVNLELTDSTRLTLSPRNYPGFTSCPPPRSVPGLQMSTDVCPSFWAFFFLMWILVVELRSFGSSANTSPLEQSLPPRILLSNSFFLWNLSWSGISSILKLWSIHILFSQILVHSSTV